MTYWQAFALLAVGWLLGTVMPLRLLVRWCDGSDDDGVDELVRRDRERVNVRDV